jgi:carbon-monoxide dehydrogenase medium subunit
VIAGGMSLLPLMKLRLASPDKLVDIGRLKELKGVRQRSDGRLAVGALTTYSELLDSPAREYGLVRDALPDIGDVQVRNRGTVGGAIAHCDPASDLPAVLLALDAEIVARSTRGEKVYPVDGFFTGPFTTALADDEIVTEVRLLAPRDDAGSSYQALSQRASGYSIVGVAAVIIKEGGSAITKANIAVTGVGDAPYRAKAVETALLGNEGTTEAIAAAAAHATDGVTVNSDIHADSEYRTAMAAVYTRRAITAALVRLDE